jgi:hypothetical protein
VNLLTLSLEDAPENGCTEVAQSGSLSARQHGCHESTVTSERQMPHCVHAPVHRMKPPLLHPPLDCVPGYPQRDELGALHHAMLPPRELADALILGVCRELPVYNTGKSRRALLRPPSMPVVRPCNARRSALRAAPE